MRKLWNQWKSSLIVSVHTRARGNCGSSAYANRRITTETFSVVRQKYYRASTELFIDDIWVQPKQGTSASTHKGYFFSRLWFVVEFPFWSLWHGHSRLSGIPDISSNQLVWTYRTQSLYNRILLHAWISSLLCDVSPSHSNFVLVATLTWLQCRNKLSHFFTDQAYE